MSCCVFVKHRDIIKFEDFDKNHPAVYLPFVIYNWLALGILPKIYTDEEINVENSRIELLQNESYLLEVLVLVINCVLNIDIKLNEKLYKNNVNQLRGVKDFSKDEILPLITIENYMNSEDSKLFIDSISKVFPPNSVIRSTDAVPCHELYKIISNKVSGTAIWGSSYWLVIHFTSLVVDKMFSSKTKEKYQESLCILTGFLDLLLPCSICRYHYSGFFKFNNEEDFNRPFQLTLPIESLVYAKNNNLFEFYSLLHDNCKPIDRKERLSVKHYKMQYERFYRISFKNRR